MIWQNQKDTKKIAVIEQNIAGRYKKDYSYALYDDDICVGDTVVVSGLARGQFWKIKQIYEVDSLDDNVTFGKDITAEVVCKVDITAYEARLNKRKQISELKEEMRKKRREIDRNDADKYYASVNPEYAEMLNKLSELNNY